MDRFRQMEDEMSRFEAEISGQAMVGSFNIGPTFIPGFGAIPPPPQPPMLIPHSVGKKVYSAQSILATASAVVSAKPTLYPGVHKIPTGPQAAAASTATTATSNQPQMDFTALQSDIEKKLKKLKSDKLSAQLAISQASALQSMSPEEFKRKGMKNRKLMRVGGGQTWEDNSLQDWPDDDFRIFCGDLGNDVTDELLTRTFNKYPSFMKSKVIRDKRTNKSKGYGFVSFREPQDFTRAMKEMNGRYVGSRPIKLRKSTWRNRCIDVVKKKEKEKTALINMLTSNSGLK